MPIVVGVNHKILIWARERAGYSLADVGRSLKKDVAVIESWETGAAAPSLSQLEKLAYQLYKRPLAVFFFPSPPEPKKTDPRGHFARFLKPRSRASLQTRRSLSGKLTQRSFRFAS